MATESLLKSVTAVRIEVPGRGRKQARKNGVDGSIRSLQKLISLPSRKRAISDFVTQLSPRVELDDQIVEPFALVLVADSLDCPDR